uniref:Uncharacterized protein n=1 Tax=Manihot esculenta TaxID=3983 RepID=A0A2C9WAY3_MANES
MALPQLKIVAVHLRTSQVMAWTVCASLSPEVFPSSFQSIDLYPSLSLVLVTCRASQFNAKLAASRSPLPAPGPASLGPTPPPVVSPSPSPSPKASVVPEPTPSTLPPESSTTPILTPPSPTVDTGAPTSTTGSRIRPVLTPPSSAAISSCSFSHSFLRLAIGFVVLKYY